MRFTNLSFASLVYNYMDYNSLVRDEFAVRTALVAMIAFMPTSPNGALGSLDYTKEERRALAIKSRVAPKFGSAERQSLINEVRDIVPFGLARFFLISYNL